MINCIFCISKLFKAAAAAAAAAASASVPNPLSPFLFLVTKTEKRNNFFLFPRQERVGGFAAKIVETLLRNVINFVSC